jgi:hypothetical protein
MGLIAFGYNRTEKRAEIVFNSGEERHNLKITAREGGDTFEFPNPTSISMSVEGQPVGVYFLEQGSNKDFAYLLNLNDDRFYPGKAPRAAFGVKLLVMHGTFYTSQLTKYAFARVTVPPGNLPFPPWDEQASFGKLAEHVSLAFELTGNQQVNLMVNGIPKRFPTAPGKRTEILFDNECRESNGHLCKHSPGSLFESLRGDFRFHRNVLDLSLADSRYSLQVARGQLTSKGLDPKTGLKPQSSDEAPCMSSGFGEPNGLPS